MQRLPTARPAGAMAAMLVALLAATFTTAQQPGGAQVLGGRGLPAPRPGQAYRSAFRYPVAVPAAKEALAVKAQRQAVRAAQNANEGTEFEVPAGEPPVGTVLPGIVPSPPRLPSGNRFLDGRVGAPTSAAPAAPDPSTEFDTITFTGFRPPDCAVAAGPAHLVGVVNAHLRIYNLAGVQIGNQIALTTFFPTDTTGFIFDPRVSFDRMSQRFILSAVGRFDNDGGAMTPTLEGTEQSTIVLAVSQTPDPTLGWNTYSFRIERGTVATMDLQWGDWPSTGFDQQAIYVSLNMLRFPGATAGGGNRTLIVDKARAIAGDALVPVVVDDLFFPSPPYAAGVTASSIKPVESAVSLTPYLMVADEYSNIGGLGVTLYTVTDPLALIGAPVITGTHLASTFEAAANGPQPGGQQALESFGTRLQKTVYHNGEIWTSHHVSTNDAVANAGGQCRFYRIDPGGGGSFVDIDNVADASLTLWYPALVPDDNNNAIAIMAGSSNTQFASLYYTRYNGITGAFDPVELLEAGTNNYLRLLNNNTRNRWGDYFDASLHVAGGQPSVWVMGELPMALAGETDPVTGWRMRAARITSTFTGAVGPNIQVNTTNLQYGRLCDGSADRVLQISNSGDADLHVLSIERTAGSANFALVDGPSLPVTIHPGAHIDYTIRFTPTAPPGPKSATFTITSDDLSPTLLNVTAAGELGEPDIEVTPCPLAFGEVCFEDLASREKTIQICNSGSCPLQVTGLSFSGPDAGEFAIVGGPTPPFSVQAGTCVGITVRFDPDSAGPKEATLAVDSNDPDEPTVACDVTGESQLASISAPAYLAFPPTVIQSAGPCGSQRGLPIQNNGPCEAKIKNVTVSGPYTLIGLPAGGFPTSLLPGELLGDGGLSVEFRPPAIQRVHTGEVQVTYCVDPASGDEVTVSIPLYGEGVTTGARLLVRQGGVAVPVVEKIHLQRIVGNRKVSNETLQDVPLQAVAGPVPELTFQFHREWGGTSNPQQLLTGNYQVTATIRVGNKRQTKTVFFSLDTCDYNPFVTVDF